MRNLFLLILFLPWVSFAQQQTSYPRDTSYMVHSTFQKLHKQYPFIRAVQPDLPDGVAHQANKVYRTLNDRQLHANIFYPAQISEKLRPGVMMVHGGGWRTGDRSLMIPLAQQLAAQGYVTVTVEYRLSPEALYPAAVHDLKAALRWMRAQAHGLQLDPNRIAILGCSAGGQLAALIGTTNGMEKLEGNGPFQEYSSDVQAIVDIDGILAFKHPESEEGAMAAQWLGGSYEEAADHWTEASALTHADQHTPPVLFIGSAFPRFQAGKNDMINILKENNIVYQTHVLKDAPHSFWLFHPWFETTLKYTADFLGKVFREP